MLLSIARVINGLLYFHYLIKRIRNLSCHRVYYDCQRSNYEIRLFNIPIL